MLQHGEQVNPYVTCASRNGPHRLRPRLISATDQDHGSQEARLKAAGCDIIRAEKVSGKSRDSRDELATVMDFIRSGDELVVVKLDRLGRFTRDVLNLVHELEEKGAALVLDHQGNHASRCAAIASIVAKIGCTAETLRFWV